MNKTEILTKFSDNDDKYFVAKLLDAVEMSNKRQKITNTDFLDLHKKSIAVEVMNILKQNFLLFGGFDGAQREMAIIYPENMDENQLTMQCDKLITFIRLDLPNMLQGKYTHRDYLGGIMKLGIKREMCGDILVDNEGAYFIVSSSISDFVLDNLKHLTRFQKSTLKIVEKTEANIMENQKEELKIIVPSERLDSIVSELARTSRNQANNIIKDNRVFINDVVEIKNSKMLKPGDIITIRGKGKFQFVEIIGDTSKGKKILKILKYV